MRLIWGKFLKKVIIVLQKPWFIIIDIYACGNVHCVNKAKTFLNSALLNCFLYTWGDVDFVLEIFDGIGSGNRRAREKRLQDLDKDKKKRLIRLICRVKGEEEVYDKTKEVGDIQLKLDDVDMVISKVLGTMKVSTEWEEVPWDYGYDKYQPLGKPHDK